jgi:hypothetical protein
VMGPDGSVYVAGVNEMVYGISASGGLLWKKKPGGTIMAPMAYDRGNLYFPTSSKRLIAYSTGGGKAWEVKLEVGATSSAAVGPCGDVYIGTPDGMLYAVSQGGTIKWKFKTAGPIEATPAVGSDGTIYVASNIYHEQHNSAVVYAIYPQGEKKWMTSEIFTETIKVPLVLDGEDNIYVLDGSATLTKIPFDHFSQGQGEFDWQIAGGAASPAISGDLLLFSASGSTNAVALADGASVWSAGYGGAVAPAISSDGKVYLTQNAGEGTPAHLYTLDMEDGAALSDVQLGGPSGNLALLSLNIRGRIALITSNGNVECYSVPKGGAAGPWTQFGGSAYHSSRRVDSPTAFISSPADGSEVTGDVNVLYGGTADPNCDSPKVSLYVQGAKVDSSSASPKTFLWLTGASQNGPYTLIAESSDKMGHSVEASISVMLNNPTPPTYTTADPIPFFSWQASGDTKFRVYLSTDPEFGSILAQSKTAEKPWLGSPGWTPSKGEWDKVMAAAGSSPVTVYWKVIGKKAGMIHLGRFFITR